MTCAIALPADRAKTAKDDAKGEDGRSDMQRCEYIVQLKVMLRPALKRGSRGARTAWG